MRTEDSLELTRHGRADTSNRLVMGLNRQNLTPAGRVGGFVLKNPSHPTRLTKTQRTTKIT